jgi:hypothetical protein
MKKIIFVFTLTVSLAFSAFSQVTLNGLTTIYGGTPTDASPVIAIATSSADAAYQSDGQGTDISQSVIHVKGRQAENLTWVEVFDTAGAHIFMLSRTVQQFDKFEYRITKNGNIIIHPWTSVSADDVLSDQSKAMHYLGNYKAERGSYLLADLRRKGSESIVASAIIFFRSTRPTLANIYLGDEMKQFMKRIADPSAKPDSLDMNKWKAQYSATELDIATGLPKMLELAPDQNAVIFYLKEQIRKGDLLEYQLVRNGEVVTGWKKNDFDNGFIWLTNLPPGKYELKMRFTIQRDNVTTYHFVVHPRWVQTLTFKFIAGGLIAAFFGFLFVLFRLRRQRQKLRSTQAQRDKAEAGLRTIYAQLNPHFIFNALSSIQGLINKGETEAANRYLSTFSRLLRESLVHSEKDRVPLSAEVQMLDTYLQLEQLRFRFQYAIKVEEGIDPGSVELPALLLQPLVENAIKHGVSALQERGHIRVVFFRKGNDLLVTVTDNGKGFNTAIPTTGYGLKLTRGRIALLTEADREHAITLSVKLAEGDGTTIVVHFRNWL